MRISRFLSISVVALGLIVPRGTYAQFGAQDSVNLDDATEYLRLINADAQTILTYVRWLEEHQAEFEPHVLSNLWDIAAYTYYSTLIEVEGFESITNQLSATDQWLYRTLVTQFSSSTSLSNPVNRFSLAGYIRRIRGNLGAIQDLLGNGYLQYSSSSGEYTWIGSDQSSILSNVRDINSKLDDLTITNAVDLGFMTNYYATYNESTFDAAGWSSLRELAVDYYDANYQEVSTNGVDMQEWTELNIWERISTALYRLVAPQGTAPDTDNLGSALNTVGDIVEDNWESVEDVDQTENYTTAFQRLANQLNTFQFEGMGDYNNLTLVPAFDWPLGGDVNYHFEGIIIHPADDGVVRVIARLFRQVFGWLWSFLLFLSFVYLTIGTSTGVIYLFTWASSCAGQLKILPFDWSKVWHNPLEYLKLGDW